MQRRTEIREEGDKVQLGDVNLGRGGGVALESVGLVNGRRS